MGVLFVNTVLAAAVAVMVYGIRTDATFIQLGFILFMTALLTRVICFGHVPDQVDQRRIASPDDKAA